MRFISTRTHGYLDYIVGVLLIIAPWLLGFATGGAEMWVPVIVGLAIIVWSLFTNYELGVVKALNMRTHLALDGLGGLLLLVSPWLFDFADLVWVPHVLVGLIVIGAALFTETVPSYGRAVPPGA